MRHFHGIFWTWIGLLLVAGVPGNAYADQKLADEIASKILRISEKLWGRKLDKKLEVHVRDLAESKNKDPRYPSFWNPKGENYQVSLLQDFDLSQTWWNMNPEDSAYSERLKKASLRQKYILTLSHEITHLFSYPSPLQPWFQEIIGMRVGEKIAIQLDSSLKPFFQKKSNQTITLKQLQAVETYNQIRPPHIEECRKFQREAYWYSLSFTPEYFIQWGKQARDIHYSPWEEKRAGETINKELEKLQPQD